MNRYLLRSVSLFILLSVAVSCKKEDAIQRQPASILIQGVIAGVNGPISGTVNQELTFNLVWVNINGTAKFAHLQDSVSSNTRFIKLFAFTNAVDTATIASKNVKSVIYTFKAAKPGIYYLKFYKADNADLTAIIDTLNIK